jgi:hypothetical protein
MPVSPLVAAAARYAAAGIAVVPLHTPTGAGCSCRLGPGCDAVGKHPRLLRGLLDASSDPRQIRWWWDRWPHANIGLATGGVLDVCDIDSSPGLCAVLDLLDLVRPTGPLVRTGNGWHLWYAGGLPSRIGFLPDVDWRGRGATAVAPPSLHVTGRRYSFAQPWDGNALPPLPDVLRRAVQPSPPSPDPAPGLVRDGRRYGQAALDGEVRRILDAARPVFHGNHRVRPGSRNNTLNIAAFRLGQLAALGELDQSTVWPALTEAALAAGLGPAETRRTIASGWRAGLRRPRR